MKQEERFYRLHGFGCHAKKVAFSSFSTDLGSEHFQKFSIGAVKYCNPFISAIKEIISSKFFLVSRSSFSYVAGVINPNKVYIPRKYGHAKLKRWIWDFSKEKDFTIELLSGI